ncbi:glutathione S-transferase [Uliginosibacterium sediminicola]|uniref:Glutathione S-transferase n=1 Tax=Uliginosibacterium sediminicola TaxID=2024550 RepID=A0ABU9YUN5_9RHOO
MKLVISLTSPYARKVRIAMREKQLAFDEIIEQPWAADTQITEYNPLGKVPALVTEDAGVLFDSNVILEYLELKAAPPLLPEDRVAALQVRQLVLLADGIADAGVAVVLERRRAAAQQDAGWVARQLGKVERGLGALEALSLDRQYLVGNAFSQADIAASCMLLWLDFRLPELDWRSRFPALANYLAPLAARPSFTATVPQA